MESKSVIRGNKEAAAFEVSLTPLEILAAEEIQKILLMLEKKVKEEKERIDNEIKALSEEFQKLPYIDGTVEYKYVRNKAGKEYYYYYYRPVGTPRRSIYLGPYSEAVPIISSLKRAREIKKKLKSLKDKQKHLEAEIHFINWLSYDAENLKSFVRGHRKTR